MDAKAFLSGFPDTLPARSGRPEVKLHRSETHFAVLPGTAPATASGDISFHPVRNYDPQLHGPNIVPVYTLGKGGAPAAPTGLVFVRFAPDVRFVEQSAELRSAGYEIAKTTSYATNAGWVRAASSRVAEALAGISKLQDLPGVINVEPEMLSRAERK
jgi:hypothetical protein